MLPNEKKPTKRASVIQIMMPAIHLIITIHIRESIIAKVTNLEKVTNYREYNLKYMREMYKHMFNHIIMFDSS